MTDLELLVDFYKDTERQGPGSSNETKKALELIEISKEDNLKIADIGCGSGTQTITLAENTKGEITAVDLFPEFLDKLKLRKEELGIKGRITTLEKSMDDLTFNSEEFDIIWSEGTTYNIGFENGS
ncbi:MAG: class I SAM-dependent methyltransferase [Ignavibacteriae bacterium]|nr:class I SAM-dependent methyltransferase [Ignavibacteriota bacterium]